MDYQVIFEIAEWERNHEEDGHMYTTKGAYDQAREAMYKLGDVIKAYGNSYDEFDVILNLHRNVMDCLKQILVEKEVSTNDVKFISYKMPHVLLFEEERYTLVDTIDMGSDKSVESHNVRFVKNI